MTLDLQALNLRAANLGTASNAGNQQLGQQDFLTLLTTQLKNQDPLSPLDNEAFVAQLAQFSTVSGITEMNASISALHAMTAGSRGDAPGWIGRTVADAEGASSAVSTVSFAADGTLLLGLQNGTTLPVSGVKTIS